MEKCWRFLFTHCKVYTNCLDTNRQTGVTVKWVRGHTDTSLTHEVFTWSQWFSGSWRSSGLHTSGHRGISVHWNWWGTVYTKPSTQASHFWIQFVPFFLTDPLRLRDPDRTGVSELLLWGPVSLQTNRQLTSVVNSHSGKTDGVMTVRGLCSLNNEEAAEHLVINRWGMVLRLRNIDWTCGKTSGSQFVSFSWTQQLPVGL